MGTANQVGWVPIVYPTMFPRTFFCRASWALSRPTDALASLFVLTLSYCCLLRSTPQGTARFSSPVNHPTTPRVVARSARTQSDKAAVTCVDSNVLPTTQGVLYKKRVQPARLARFLVTFSRVRKSHPGSGGTIKKIKTTEGLEAPRQCSR